MASRPETLLRVSDLDLMPDDGKRYELIDGDIFVSKSPTLTHQLISVFLTHSLQSYLLAHPIGKVIAVPGLVLSDVDGVIPDIIFVSNERLKSITKEDRLHGAPELVIEILSPGPDNSRRDRITKRYLYGKFNVDEYWVVDPESRTVEVYRCENKQMVLSATLSEADILSSPLLPDYRCRVSEIFAV